MTGAACAAAMAIAAGYGVLAQSREWPTYGHDPGGMRFSPLTQIAPENVSRLKVAWEYHMRPPGGAVAPEGRGANAGAGGGVGDTPDGAPGGRGRGRFGSGFRPSEVTPL